MALEIGEGHVSRFVSVTAGHPKTGCKSLVGMVVFFIVSLVKEVMASLVNLKVPDEDEINQDILVLTGVFMKIWWSRYS